jgi:hypothetical protein
VCFLIPVLAFWGGHLIFRILYYHSLVPNSVVAKLGRGARPPASGEILRWVIASNGLPLLALAGAWLGWKRLPGRRRLIAGAFCAYAAAMIYQVGIGRVAAVGYRYLIPAIAAVLILVFVLVEALHTAWGDRPVARRAAPVILLFLAFYLHPHAGTPGTVFASHGDAPRSRFHIRLWEFLRDPDWVERWAWWHHEPILINANAGRWLRDWLHPEYPEAVLAADQMGALGYYASLDQRIIDLGGLMDRRIAREGLRPEDLVRRSPDFLVLYALLEAEEPVLPELKELVRSEEFREAYTVWWELVPRDEINRVKFLVYGKRTEEASGAAGRVELGPTTAEFERWWRVM